MKVQLTEKQLIAEAIDLKTLQNGLQAIKKFIPNLDITTLLKNASKIIQAIKELAAMDKPQIVTKLAEAKKKPLLFPYINKYGILVAGIAMAIMQMAGAPPEYPSDVVMNMISMGVKGKTAGDFFGSMNAQTAAEFAGDLFTTSVNENKKIRVKLIKESKKVLQELNYSMVLQRLATPKFKLSLKKKGDDSAFSHDASELFTACIPQELSDNDKGDFLNWIIDQYMNNDDIEMADIHDYQDVLQNTAMVFFNNKKVLNPLNTYSLRDFMNQMRKFMVNQRRTVGPNASNDNTEEDVG